MIIVVLILLIMNDPRRLRRWLRNRSATLAEPRAVASNRLVQHTYRCL